MTGEYLNLRLVAVEYDKDHPDAPPTETTVFWFCPAEITDSVSKNNLFASDRTNAKGSIAIDKRVYRNEITIQGYAVPSSEMQPDHRAAMQARFGASNVTPRMQIRLLKSLAEFVGGAYWLYAYEDRYGAAAPADLDYSDHYGGHIYPPVTFDEFRFNPEPGLARIPYTAKFVVGFPSSTGCA